VRQVEAVCERISATAIVVFDRAAHAPFDAPHVSVRAARAGETADDVVRAIVDASEDPSRLTVVSSDKPLYSYARTRGAAVLRCHEWKKLARG
jgi:hypothetical protein